MQMTPKARRWLDETVARVLRRHPLREPERSGIHYEVMGHLHGAAERKAQEAGATEVESKHLEEALQEMGGEEALVEAFVAPHARVLPRAGFLKRTFAFLIDLMLLGITAHFISALLVIPYGILTSGWGFPPLDVPPFDDPLDPLFDGPFHPPWTAWGILSGAVWTVLTLGYFAYMESTWQQTLGKMALKLRVVRTDGGPIGLRETIMRNVAKVHFGLLTVDTIVFLLLLQKERQRLSDRVAGTAVLEEG